MGVDGEVEYGLSKAGFLEEGGQGVGVEVGHDAGDAPGDDDFEQVHLILQEKAKVAKATGASSVVVQGQDAPDELLGLHGAFHDLAHAVGHWIVLRHHAVVEFADGEDAGHEVAEVVHEAVGEGGETFPPDGVG